MAAAGGEMKPILPVPGQRNILITSALPYVNNVPHLGNIIGCVLSADVYARFCRLRGYNVIYMCGTDEYGTATETKALQAGKTPKQICDEYFEIHEAIYKWFDCKFDKFGRTTNEPWQKQICQEIFWSNDRNGNVKEDTVQQLHCESCNRFLSDRFVEGTCHIPGCGYTDARGDQCDKCGQLVNAVELKNPRCATPKSDGTKCGATPVIRSSKHLFLDLPALTPQLTKWFEEASVKGAWSENSIALTKTWLRDGLKPRAITRDLKWGTPCPKEGFEDKVFYVWFDAPIGYISITAEYAGDDWVKWWKPENSADVNVELVQFMGKDNVPFHCVIFPSTLIGTGEPWTMLHHISTTEYLNYEDCKFSKSRGTGVFGDNARETGIPSEVWRYYLITNRPEISDSIFSWDDFLAKTNNELLSNFGNFVNRIIAFVKTQMGGRTPANVTAASFNDADKAFIAKVREHIDGHFVSDGKVDSEGKPVERFVDGYLAVMDKVKLKAGLQIVMNISMLGNKYMQDNAPWVSIKQDRPRCDVAVTVCLNLIYTLAVLMNPFMPATTSKIFEQLNLAWDGDGRGLLAASRFDGTSTFGVPCDHEIGVPAHLFKALAVADIKRFREQYGEKKEAADGPAFPMSLVVGNVLTCTRHPAEDAPHLLVLTLAVGAKEPLQIVSGLGNAYKPDELVGKNLVVLTNVKHTNFKKVRSQGMILTGVEKAAAAKPAAAAGEEAKDEPAAAPAIGVLFVDKPPGTKVLPATCSHQPAKIFDVQKSLPDLNLHVGAGGTAVFGEAELPFLAEGTAVMVEKVAQGAAIR